MVPFKILFDLPHGRLQFYQDPICWGATRGSGCQGGHAYWLVLSIGVLFVGLAIWSLW